MTICKKCVLESDSVPEITFDEEGVCNFCRTWERLEKKRQEEKKNLPKVLAELKKGLVIGLSGGGDSSTCLELLRKEGLKPKLAFTFDNGWNKPIADEKVAEITEGLPLKKIKIDYKELQMAFVKAGVPNIEIPTDHILMALSYKIAAEQKVKYIISGGNHATEGIMPESWSYWSGDLKLIKAIYGRSLKGLPTCGLLKWNYYKWIKKIKVINLLDYYEYKYKFQEYGEKHCENYFTEWFQHCYLPVKFGIDKRKAHYSSLINSGQMTREEAIRKMTEPLRFQPLILPEQFLKYPKKSHYDYKTNQKLYDFLCQVVKNIRKIRGHAPKMLEN